MSATGDAVARLLARLKVDPALASGLTVTRPDGFAVPLEGGCWLAFAEDPAAGDWNWVRCTGDGDVLADGWHEPDWYMASMLRDMLAPTAA